MRTRWGLARLLLVVAGLSSSRASAQNGTLRGTATTAAGQPLAFAVATIRALDLQPFTNNEGKFFFADIRPGTYRLSVRQLCKLLRTEIELTKIPSDLQGLLRVQATTFFDAIVRGLPNIGEVIATSDLKAATRVSPARAVERLLRLRVVFLKQVPDGDSTDVRAARLLRVR